MKRVFIFLVFFYFPLQMLSAQKEILVEESLSFYSNILKQDVRYSICLPPDYFKSGKSYPVVYLLHGLGDDESSWLEYGNICRVSSSFIKKGEIVPMIFVVPQGFRTYYSNDVAGKFLYQDMFIHELIPYIDSVYRTVPDKQHRATMGYSMGGFGALMLPLKYPEVFSVCVPLSISVRTDAQYMLEDAEGWDKQWGSILGGVGKKGEDRITDFYKANSPFHIIENCDIDNYKDLKIYIDNGDDEYNLCRSNEELHILMREKSFPHEFRVRNGGHTFEYWRSALPNGLHFISDAFEGNTYRGDIHDTHLPKKPNIVFVKENELYNIIFPDEYKNTSALYPVLYFLGDFNKAQEEQIGGTISKWIKSGTLSPMILIFVKHTGKADDINAIISETESLYRVRKTYRFRAIIANGIYGEEALKLSMDSLQFTSCAILDGNPDTSYAAEILKHGNRDILGKTWYYIDGPDKGKYFAENGFLHILFRESDLYHEYRVREGLGGFQWFMSGLYDAVVFTQNKIHY
ncbi:MAG: esterase family protein [Bacteroidales bacterium]|nr:esterase family protein [Bacteroidales bacterium]MCB9012586.1 esterase family protein [Bacteroidales bacterium]